MRWIQKSLLIFLLAALPLSGALAQAEGGTLTPIGGGYPDTFPGFLEAALPYVETLDTDRFYILMMPMSFTYDIETLTATDLLDNSLATERRRRQLENACADVVAEAALELACEVVVPPIYTREAALNELALQYFAEDLGAVYFVGGDQTYAMDILNGSPVEDALTDAFARGVVMGGNSAGAAIESAVMIGGFTGENDYNDQLREGAVDLWMEEDRRGLPFGITSAIIEQHFFQYSRPGRLLNAIVQADVPRLGIGVDGYTGVVIENETLVRDVFGLYSVGILDAETYGTADDATYVEGFLSAQSALFHTLAPGDFSYNTTTLEHSLAPVPEEIERNYEALRAPEGAGTLTLIGNAVVSMEIMDTMPGETVVLIIGYADEEDAAAVSALYGQGAADVIVSDGEDALGDFSTYANIIIHADDQSALDLDLFLAVEEAWLDGADLTLDDAAVALAGAYYSAHPAIDYDNDDGTAIESAEQGSFIEGGTDIAEGLGLIDATFEPRIIENTRWGRLISLAYEYPELLAIGIPDEAILTITSEGATVGGDNGVFVYDFSGATLGLGDNGAFVIANGLMDVYAPTQVIGE